MTGDTHPAVAAVCRAMAASRARMALLEGDHLDLDTTIGLLHDYASSASLIEDLPLPPDDQGLRSIGATGTMLMRLSETLSTLVARERATSAAAARQLTARHKSDRNVLASLLGLSILFNVLLAFVALR
ncbi:hypothetical protein [uncultured Bradyrhizobium sp.]|uniref:hypothetical protein n=2 Tax=Alphaproteobacteria TaxID=28211 RepID=UPI002624F4EB|nr:hypothetical protein [uncultured Bradyrhizobium sp.]